MQSRYAWRKMPLFQQLGGGYLLIWPLGVPDYSFGDGDAVCASGAELDSAVGESQTRYLLIKLVRVTT